MHAFMSHSLSLSLSLSQEIVSDEYGVLFQSCLKHNKSSFLIIISLVARRHSSIDKGNSLMIIEDDIITNSITSQGKKYATKKMLAYIYSDDSRSSKRQSFVDPFPSTVNSIKNL